MKDYYSILGLSPHAASEEIRKAYRKMALRHHPDRNLGDPLAEERFKEIAEAYGVLIDPLKRKEYDEWQITGSREETADTGFGYSQEEILRDLSRDPGFNRIFQELLREFQKAGIRSDKHFFKQTFGSGRGIIFGGVFTWGPHGSRRMGLGRGQRGSHLKGYDIPKVRPPGFTERLGQRIGRVLMGQRIALPEETGQHDVHGKDLIYRLNIGRDKALQGTWVKIAVDHGDGKETLKVKIPPNTKAGTRLRLRGKGLHRDGQHTDLYLLIDVA